MNLWHSTTKVLIFCAHPDDETLGCGGTIAKMVKSGAHVTVVCVTGGETGVDCSKKYAKNIKEHRNKELQTAAKILGISQLINLGISCQKVQNDQKTFHEFIRLIRQTEPDIILTHSTNDHHRDHRTVHTITKEAAWKAYEDIHPELGNPHRTGLLLEYEVLQLISNPEFLVDTTNFHEVKQKALRIYQSQENIITGAHQFIDAAAIVRGYAAGCKFAEAFRVIKTHPCVIE